MAVESPSQSHTITLTPTPLRPDPGAEEAAELLRGKIRVAEGVVVPASVHVDPSMARAGNQPKQAEASDSDPGAPSPTVFSLEPPSVEDERLMSPPPRSCW